MAPSRVPPSPSDDDDGFFGSDPLGLGSARGGRRKSKPLMVEVVRELTCDDLPSLHAGHPPTPIAPKLRHSHHQLAQLLARGTAQEDAALITGYSPSYISTMKSSPAFAELLSHYGSIQEEKFADVLDRMKSLGLSTLDELQERLELDTESWSHRELMEMAELLLVKPMRVPPIGAGGSSNGSGSAGVQVQVNFVTATQPALPASADTKVIDHETN